MKLKDLDESTTDCQLYKLKLPKKALEQFKNYCGGEKEMYPVGWVHDAFMMSPDPMDAKTQRLYPMPEEIKTSELLEWEIAE